MLAQVLNVPNSAEDWSIWSYSNYDAVNQIRQAIFTQKNVTLADYQLEPIDFADIDTWLSNNQQAHTDFGNELGLDSSDLLHTDLSDPKQREAWIWLNFNELLQACQKLGIGP